MNLLKVTIILAVSVLLPYAIFMHAFEIPDEQAHYATTHFLNSQGRMPTKHDPDNLSLEEFETLKIFGIVEGDNKYSYHPEFRIEQVAGPTGKYEDLIKSFNTQDNRSTFSTHQAALYPPLYYLVTFPFYKLVESGDIITRLFLTRVASVLITALTVGVAYLIGYAIFKQRLYAIALSSMTLLFPMTAYIGGGVNSDNLHNLLFACFIYLVIRLIDAGWDTRRSLLLGTVIGLDILTKPQAYIMLPILAMAVLIRWRWNEWRSILSAIFYVLVPIFLIAGWYEIPKFLTTGDLIPEGVRYTGWDHFRSYSIEYFHRLYSAMLVWYWGVYKWLGIILPRPFWWIANRLLLLGIGVSGLRLLYQIFHKKFDFISRIILFSFMANLIYVGALFWFDWQFYQTYGRSLGMQARYYMPLLTLQLFIIIQGMTTLARTARLKHLVIKVLIFFFVTLHLAGTYTLLAGYYDLYPLSTFIDQLSQYKPDFAKGSWWYLWFSLYLAGIISTTVLALKTKNNRT